jgi:hypothetical protein
MKKQSSKINANNGTYSEDQLRTMLNDAKLNTKVGEIAPQKCLSIVSNHQSTIMGTLGNFSLIIGKPKSRKTFFVSLLVASVFDDKRINEKIEGSLPANQNRILYFDTEQAQFHVQKAINRISRIVNIKETSNLESYCLRRFSPEERLTLIEFAIKNTSNLGLVVIDGLRDLITSINNEEQAIRLSCKLLKWSEEKNIHIIGVLHENKGDNNARGHIGTELVNKAETVLTVAKQKGNNKISIVSPKYCRESEFESFAFEINEEGLPVIVEDLEIATENETPKRNPVDFSEKFHHEIIEELSLIKGKYSYRELWQEVKVVLSVNNINVGDNKAKAFVKYYKEQNLISKVGNVYSLAV